TTGSKLFLGASALSLVGAVVLGFTVGGQGAIIALIAATVVFAGLAALNFFINDGNVSSMEPNATVRAAANTAPAARSVWPLLLALGIGLLVIGADTRPMLTLLGLVVIAFAGLQWMMQSWSERATADPAYNAKVRSNLLAPLEFPVLAAAGVAAVVYSFSRILLWVDKAGGLVVFALLATLILVGGYLIASKPNLKRGLITGIGAIVGLGLISTGAVMAIDGQRKIEHHPTPSAEPAVCSEEGKDAHVDKRAPQDVSIKSSLAAHVVLKDGKLAAYSQGLRGARPDLTFARGAFSNVLFKNEDSAARRFTVNMGQFVDSTSGTDVVTKPVSCTTLVEPGGQYFLSLKFEKPSFASAAPYTITVPGIEDQAITVYVP
ncbi:MAG TPA: hypothetical protein PKV27_04830, partial [Ilumatobacteraceae bacterium]|nr:hypothetical protein [Ilumatobacteraceae bacterium]